MYTYYPRDEDLCHDHGPKFTPYLQSEIHDTTMVEAWFSFCIVHDKSTVEVHS